MHIYRLGLQQTPMQANIGASEQVTLLRNIGAANIGASEHRTSESLQHNT